MPGRRVDYVTPGILALAVLSTAFTGQAIATGFDRRYGVLKRLGATPLPRRGLVLGQDARRAGHRGGQVARAVARRAGAGLVAARARAVAVVLLLVLGTAAFSGLGLLLAGTLRAEATLAVANLVHLLLLGTGAVVVPLERFPDGMAAVLSLTPMVALSEGLRDVLQDGVLVPWGPIAVLTAWAVAAVAAASRWFRWE